MSDYVLVKFTDHKWAKKFMEGEIFANSLYNFRKINDDGLGRGDISEGPYSTINKIDFNTHLFGKNVSVSDEFKEAIVGNIILLDEWSKYIKVFSMYMLQESNSINAKVRKFGDTFILIKDEERFMKRVINALNIQNPYNIEFMEAKKVQYYDFDTNTQYIDVFNKCRPYEWQNEFRISFFPSNKVSVFDILPLKINIGNIKDIAIMGKTKDLINKVNDGKVKVKDLI